jgi:hypothetical protein
MGSHQATLEEDVTLFNGQTFSSLYRNSPSLGFRGFDEAESELGSVVPKVLN